MSLVAVTGTGTDVGKTYVTAAVAAALRARGRDVAARKPVQSFAPGDERRHATDADVLACATGEAADAVCPAHRRLPAPVAPPMAAEALGLPPFAIDDLVRETRAAAPPGALVLVETAGGVRSPIAADGDCAAFVDALGPRLVVLVADAGLGTINLVRLSREALGGQHVVVFLNRFDAGTDLHVRNGRWLRARESLDVVTDIEALTSRIEALTAPPADG